MVSITYNVSNYGKYSVKVDFKYHIFLPPMKNFLKSVVL